MTTFLKFLFLGVMLTIALVGGGRVGEIVRNPDPTDLQAAIAGPGSAPAPGPAISASPNIAGGNGAVSAPALSELKIFYPISAEAPPKISAQAALVADLETGEIYFDLNSRKRWPMASITKFMTAAYAMRNMDPTSEITLAAGDFPPDAGDVSKGLKPGDVYRLKDLLQATLISSSNEAAEAIANFYGRDDFIAGLRAMAREWGMNSTHFADPTGLSAVDQSTAGDLRIMALKIYQAYPGILKTTREKTGAITEVASGRREVLANINLFAGQSWFLGGKTGYTDEANGNLLTVLSHQSQPVVVVVLGTSDRFGETEKLMNWFRGNYRLRSS